MMILQSERLDIIVTESKDYKQDTIYQVIYGLQVSKHGTISEALKEFYMCAKHSIACEGE